MLKLGAVVVDAAVGVSALPVSFFSFFFLFFLFGLGGGRSAAYTLPLRDKASISILGAEEGKGNPKA